VHDHLPERQHVLGWLLSGAARRVVRLSSGDFDGTVCSGTGPTITTTCSNPITASASFLSFTSGGDPWNVTLKAVNDPLQFKVLRGCSTGSSCTSLAAGASTMIVVTSNTVIAIVNGTSCASWQITYQSK